VIYLEAVKRAGSLDADKVRETLLKMEIKTAFGEYKVDADGFQLAHKMVMFQWQDGKKVTVWPDELANGKARYLTPLEPAVTCGSPVGAFERPPGGGLGGRWPGPDATQ
jgi:hypothetical protein